MHIPTTSVTEDPELVLIEGLAQAVVERYHLKQIVFETNYHWQYHHDHPDASECVLKFVSFQATRDHEGTSFEEALRKTVTSEEEAKGQAILFKVRLRAKEILSAQKPKKKKKKEILPPTPPSSRALARLQMERDLLDSSPRLPGDEEPDFNPSADIEPPEFKTVREVRDMAREQRAQVEISAENARAFLEEPAVPKTMEFEFVVRRFGPSYRGENDRRRRLSKARIAR